jgi:hypothetical protein
MIVSLVTIFAIKMSFLCALLASASALSASALNGPCRHAARGTRMPLRHPLPIACADAAGIIGRPTAEQSARLDSLRASPSLQPREVISSMLAALHRSNIDSPRLHFGCEVALRFLAPSNPASKASAEQFANYLSQTWYQPLLRWNEYRWEGDLTLLGEREAFQQVSVRADPKSPWVSVRWILLNVPFYENTDQWMVEAVSAWAAATLPALLRGLDDGSRACADAWMRASCTHPHPHPHPHACRIALVPRVAPSIRARAERRCSWRSPTAARRRCR